MFSWIRDIFAPKEEPLVLQEADIISPEEPDLVFTHDLIPAQNTFQARLIKEVIIHCSATGGNMDIGAREIKKWHTDPKPAGRGWADIGYHYVIRLNGQVELGRDRDKDGLVMDEVGAHAFGWNKHSIGICLVGGIGSDGKSAATFTRDQQVALSALLIALRQTFPGIRIMGHRDTGANKDCPCFDVDHWLRTGQMINPTNPR